MSEPAADLPDVEIPDVDVPDVDTPTPDDQGDMGDLTDAQMDEALQAAREDEVEYGPDGALRFRDGVDPLEVYQRSGAPVNAGIDEDDATRDERDRYARQVAGYGLPRGSIGGGSARRKRRNPLGAKVGRANGGGSGGFGAGNSLIGINLFSGALSGNSLIRTGDVATVKPANNSLISQGRRPPRAAGAKFGKH